LLGLTDPAGSSAATRKESSLNLHHSQEEHGRFAESFTVFLE
jgi:hypothetical protein